MKKLIQHELNFEKTAIHFENYLSERHHLATALKNNIDFRRGHFYTLLTKDADLSRIYKFEIGEIIPQNPVEEIYIESLDKTFMGRWINSIKDEFSDYLYKKMRNYHLACLMEDLIQSPTDPHVNLYHQIGLHFGEEIFYLITQKNLTKSLVKKALKECGGWDCIAALFTLNNFELNNKEIKEGDFLKICSNISMISISAYDGEGYLIWEKNKSQ